VRRIGGQAHLRKKVASKSKSLDLFDRPPQSKTSIGLPRHRSMAAMPMMASIPEDSSFRDWVGEEEQVAHRSPVSLDNGYRPTTGSAPHWKTDSFPVDAPALQSGSPNSWQTTSNQSSIKPPRQTGDWKNRTPTHWPPLLTRQRSLQSPLEGEERCPTGGSVENEKARSGGRQLAKTREETTKKRQRVSSSSSSSLPPVWHLIPVTCLYLLFLLLIHLLSPLLTSLPSLSTSSPSTCGLYNQSIVRHSSL